MLEVTSKRKTFKFLLDGEVKEVPCELTAKEATELGKFQKERPSDAAAAVDWFTGYLASYIGEIAYSLSIEAVGELFTAWGEEQSTKN